MTTTAADRTVPAPATVVWLADRWRRLDHAALLTRIVAVSLALGVATLLATTPLWLPETVFGRRYGYPYPTWDDSPDPQRWFGLVATCAGLLGVAAVLVAPRLPRLAWLGAGLPFILVPVYGTVLASSWLALAAVAVVVATRRPRAAILPWASAVALAIGWHVGGQEVLFPHGPGAPSSGVSGLLGGLGVATYTTGAAALAALLGHVLRTSTARARDAESVALDAVAASASVTERARLARELHNVVAHHVSLVAIRAESAPFRVPDLDPQVAATFAEIATDARTALAELRHVLAVLRRDDEAPLLPLATGDVADLVDVARAAGQEVTVAGTWPRTGPGVGHVLHRAVQEGLSNARRHAPGAPVHVRVRDGAGLVGFTMSNPVDHTVTTAPAHGLTGMRERVEALGGTLAADVADGRFVLAVSLPVAP